MPEAFAITVNGRAVSVESGCTVASAISIAGLECRRSVSGQPRGPLCAMGICLECRATVNGQTYARTCQLLCEPAMEIVTS